MATNLRPDIVYFSTKYRLYLDPYRNRLLTMKLSESIKPISYLKSHTAKAVRDVSRGQQPMVITQHGEAKAVLQDITSYEQMQESLALLKMLAQSSKSIREGRSKPVKSAFADVRKQVKATEE